MSNVDTSTLITATAATTTQTSADQENPNHLGVVVFLDVTSAGTGSLSVEIQAKDPVSGNYVALQTGTAVTANGTTIYHAYPGAAGGTESFNGPLPTTWRVRVVANNANATTYTVGASLIG